MGGEPFMPQATIKGRVPQTQCSGAASPLDGYAKINNKAATLNFCVYAVCWVVALYKKKCVATSSANIKYSASSF